VLALGRVHLGDCLDLLGELDAGSVSMVFADLPYGVTANRWDKQLDLKRLWPALERACRKDAAMVFTAVQPFASDLVLSNRRCFRYEVIWKKSVSTGFLSAQRRPLRIHENVLVFWRRHPPYFPQKTTGHPLVRVTPSRLAENKNSQNYGTELGRLLKTKCYESTERYPTTVLEVDCVEQHDSERRHPTQKPEELAGWFIRTFTEPDALVLDPTAGSGSTLCAAKSLGRRSVGFDIDPESVRKANDALVSRLDFAR
jgi:site-specific DNA-methyltransferase (adenine-specific)